MVFFGSARGSGKGSLRRQEEVGVEAPGRMGGSVSFIKVGLSGEGGGAGRVSCGGTWGG